MDYNEVKNLHSLCKGSIYQSPEWAEVLEKSGKSPIFITHEDNGLKAFILAYTQEIKTPLGKKKILVADGTPLFPSEALGEEILRKFKQESKKYLYGQINPTVINPSQEIFIKSNYKNFNNHTILIRLDKTQEDLFKQLEKKSARWGVKTAEKNNLTFSEITSIRELTEFYEIYVKTAESGGFSSKPFEFLTSLYGHPNIAKLFTVKNQGKIVAGAVLLIDYDYTILSLTSANEQGNELQAMPFLYWNLILYSKKLEKKYFDLGGYLKEAKKGEKLYNVNKFKENFGGEVVDQPSYATNMIYVRARSLMKKLSFIKKLYKKK